MATVSFPVGTAHFDTTGLSMMSYARHYRAAGLICATRRKKLAGFDPVPYQMLCQSLELQLKGYIWFVDRLTRNQLRDKYGHHLALLWKDANSKGIGYYAVCTPLRERTVAILSPYYTKRQFNYLDIDMMFRGFKDIDAEPKALATLAKLTGRLDAALYQPVLRAS